MAKSHGHLLINLAVTAHFMNLFIQRFRLSSGHTNFLEQ